MELLRVKILLGFLNMKEEDLTVTNLVVSLGEEKYAISRAFSALEKEGLLDRSEKRRPVLTPFGRGVAEQYCQKVEGVLGHLIYAGVPHEDAREDAIVMAVYCKDATFQKVRQQGISRRVKLGFHEGLKFDGSRLCRLYQNGIEPLTFLIYQEKSEGDNHLSKWNDRFENPGKLLTLNGQGQVALHALRGSKEYHFSYWNGEEWRSMQQQGSVLSFPAEFLQFQSIGKDEGRMLYGKIKLCIQKGDKKEQVLFTTYIA